MEQYQKHFVDISKHIEALLHLPVVTRETAGLIKLATKNTKLSPMGQIIWQPLLGATVSRYILSYFQVSASHLKIGHP